VPVAIQFAESQNYPLLFSGPSHSCVIKAAVPRFGVGSGQQAVGPVYCWGRNDFGQLGDGTTIDRSTPVLAANGAEFSELAVGGSHTCGIAGGAVYCWGSNSDGQLGGGSFGGSASTPVRAASSTFFAHLTAGERHTCALNGSRVAYCWGLNAEGQLGDGTTTSRSVPTAVGPYYP
jgi:alpha-tubulin suppressor-like RCC1 family protein